VVRNRIEIIAQILEVVNECSDDGVTKTKIMYKAFLNYAQLKEYLTILTDNGLLSYDLGTQTFKTTEKALRFLKACNQLDQLTKE
jgi:predicted transcriptional regulator